MSSLLLEDRTLISQTPVLVVVGIRSPLARANAAATSIESLNGPTEISLCTGSMGAMYELMMGAPSPATVVAAGRHGPGVGAMR